MLPYNITRNLEKKNEIAIVYFIQFILIYFLSLIPSVNEEKRINLLSNC